MMPMRIWSLENKQLTSGEAGKRSREPWVFWMLKLTRKVAGSNHSEAEPMLKVIVLTPVAEAEFTFEKPVAFRL